ESWMQDIKASQENKDTKSGHATLLTQVEQTHGQIETKISAMSDALNGKLAKNQDRISELAQAIRSMSDDSTSTGQKLESRIGYLEGNFHDIQILSKDENIKGLKAYINEETRKNMLL
ncbi:hypothetical protein ACQP3J_27690, partial [Escherichia coli]